MNWNPFSKARRSQNVRKPSHRSVFRPRVEALENRELLSVTSSIFSLDQGASSLTLSGTVAGNNIQQQGVGSLTAHYFGNQVIEWDLSGKTINFVGAGSVLTAMNSGSWQPKANGDAGNEPANYGAKFTYIIFTINVAVRNTQASATTDSPLTLQGGGPSYMFSSTQNLNILNGQAAYNGAGQQGSVSIAGQSTPNQSGTPGTFLDQGSGQYKLTSPISVTLMGDISGQPYVLHIIGTVVGNATLPVIDLTNGSIPGVYDYATTAVGGAGPVLAEDPAASVTLANGNINSMTVTLTNRPDDVLEFLNADTSATPNLSASYDPGSGILSISGPGTAADYQTVLETVSYENDNSTPDTTDRTITFVAQSDANTSVLRTTTMSVQAGGKSAILPPFRSVEIASAGVSTTSSVTIAPQNSAVNDLALLTTANTNGQITGDSITLAHLLASKFSKPSDLFALEAAGIDFTL